MLVRTKYVYLLDSSHFGAKMKSAQVIFALVCLSWGLAGASHSTAFIYGGIVVDHHLVKLLLPRRLRILKSWLQLLCFVLNFRRPWWKDCCLLRYCLFWFQWYGQEVWNILGTPRPVEISLVQFAYHWFSFAFHDFSGPVCVSGGALWCVVLWARWSKLHMPTHAGCCALSALITLALSQNKALAWAALLLPSFGIAEADFVPLHNFMPGDRRYNNSCFLISLSLEAYSRCLFMCSSLYKEAYV